VIQFDYGADLVGRDAGPDLTPMIDMIFLLLIFFLLTSFFFLPALNVSLPRSQEPEAGQRGAPTVTLHADGSLSLQGQPLQARDLGPTLSALYAASSGESQRALIIEADRRVPFGRVVQVMEAARGGGAQEIAFMVEPAAGQ
jgi:biopolymer transport protein ExbD